jgi:C_GCAxxG_C_C family probable redox protein
MDRDQQIKEILQNGFNCAQAVALLFAKPLKQEQKTMLSAAAGFGGGMGRQAMTCGALTGACIVLGFDRGQVVHGDSETKAACYQSVQDFFGKFVKIHGATACKDLLGCDISSPEGFELHKSGLHKEMCLGFIKSAVDILDKMGIGQEIPV